MQNRNCTLLQLCTYFSPAVKKMMAVILKFDYKVLLIHEFCRTYFCCLYCFLKFSVLIFLEKFCHCYEHKIGVYFNVNYVLSSKLSFCFP